MKQNARNTMRHNAMETNIIKYKPESISEATIVVSPLIIYSYLPF